jgi:hypothetical protein
MKEELRSSETSVLTRTTRRNIPEDNILPGICLHQFKDLGINHWKHCRKEANLASQCRTVDPTNKVEVYINRSSVIFLFLVPICTFLKWRERYLSLVRQHGGFSRREKY